MGPPGPPPVPITASPSGASVPISIGVPSLDPSTAPPTVSTATSTLPFFGGGAQLSTPVSTGNAADRSSVHDSSASSSSSGHLSIMTGDLRSTSASTPPVPAGTPFAVPVASTGVLQPFSQAGRGLNPIYTAASISQPLTGKPYFLYLIYILAIFWYIKNFWKEGSRNVFFWVVSFLGCSGFFFNGFSF